MRRFEFVPAAIATTATFVTFVIASGCTGTTSAPSPLPVPPVLAPVQMVSAAPAETVAQAAVLVQAQPGYRFTFEMAMHGIPELPGAGFTLAGSGATDQVLDRSAMALDLRGLRELLLSSGGATATELNEFLGDGQIEVVQDGDTVYLKMPFLAQRMGAGTPWIGARLPGGATGGAGVGAFGALGGLGGLGGAGSPADYFDQIRSLDLTVRETGSDEIRGTQTRRYSGNLDVRKLLSAQLTPDQAAQLNAAMPLIDAFRIPYDVWIAEDGLPRRITTRLDFGGFGAPQPGVPSPAMTMTYELFDYGAPGDIPVPAPSQVTLIDPQAFEALDPLEPLPR